MTKIEFKNYLVAFDLHIGRTKARPVLLLLDNASSHNAVYSLRLTWVRVAFYPANATGWLQILDAGVIKAIKDWYYSSVDHHLAVSIVAGVQFRIHRWTAVSVLDTAWKELPSSVIRHCAIHTGTLGATAEAELRAMDAQTDEAPRPSIEYTDNEYRFEQHEIAEEEFLEEHITELQAFGNAPVSDDDSESEAALSSSESESE